MISRSAPSPRSSKKKQGFLSVIAKLFAAVLISSCATTSLSSATLHAEVTRDVINAPPGTGARDALSHDNALGDRLAAQAAASGKDEFEEYCRLLEQALSKKQFYTIGEFLVTKGNRRARISAGSGLR